MSASSKLYKIRCKGEYPGFTTGCEYLGHIGYGPFGELGMMRLSQFEKWHEPFLPMTSVEIITMVNHGYWRKVGDL